MDLPVQSSISIHDSSDMAPPKSLLHYLESLFVKNSFSATFRADNVHVVQPHEYKRAALSLAEAFIEDHTALYFTDCPDTAHWTAAQKWDLHLSLTEYVVYAHILNGLVLAAGDFEAIALWMPPGKNLDDWFTILCSGQWRLNYKLSKEGRARYFGEFLELLHQTKHNVLGHRDEDAYYLVYIGCKPSGRGKGHARKLVEAVTKLADAEGRMCYLESSSEVNLIIYRKFGFEVARNIYLQRAEEPVQIDVMVRRPKIEKM